MTEIKVLPTTCGQCALSAEPLLTWAILRNGYFARQTQNTSFVQCWSLQNWSWTQRIHRFLPPIRGALGAIRLRGIPGTCEREKRLLNIHSWQSSIAMYERKQINDPWLLDNHIYFLVYTESKKSRSNIIEIACIARPCSTAPIYSAFKCLVFHILVKVFAWNSVNSEFIKLS